MKLLTFFKLVRNAFWNDDEWARYYLAERVAGMIYPKYKFSEFGRLLLDDSEFLADYERFETDNCHSYDRKYFLRELVRMTLDLPGDTAECGAFRGASSYLICSVIRASGKKHHIFDSFEGLSRPVREDSSYWSCGDLHADLDTVRENLSDFDFVEYHKGWIPTAFPEVQDARFSFVHIDVDLYQPTLDSVRFFYDRMVEGGVILCDDYGFVTCPGAKKAFDDFFADRREYVVNVPTGQAFVVKR